jgi:nucleotide-binding universal stress UspA family protein
MFTKIVVPLDLTERHQPALETAAQLARQHGGEVTLLHVIELIPGLPMEEEKTFYQRLERIAREHLERHAAVLTDRQIACRDKILFGQRAAEIVRFAQEHANLVILTAPRLSPENIGARWGSLSHQVSLLVTCPVLLVK